MPVLLLEPTIALWTDEAAPGVSHGGEATLQVKAVGGSARYSMVKYDISLIPAAVTIIDARIRFYFTGVGPADALLSVYKCTSVWDEADNWINNPTVDATPLSIAGDGLPVANTWEDFTSDPEGYNANDGVGSPNWWMQRQVQRWYDATDVNHGILLKATNGVGAAEWTIIGRTGTAHIVPILEITYATQDTLPPTSGGDTKAFVGNALAELNSSNIKDVSFKIVVELEAGDLDVTDDFIAGPTLRRKLPFINEDMDLGNFNFQLSNKDGKYSPTNRDSDFWLNRAAGKQVVVTATVKDQTVTIYEGTISETPQHGDKRVEILTSPTLRRKLDYVLKTELIDYTANPWEHSTITDKNPADMFYEILHNYMGEPDAKFNLTSFANAKTEWTAQGLKVHATLRGETSWDRLNELQRATLGSLYQDFQGRWALKVWVPTSPTAVELSSVNSFRWGEDLTKIKNHVTATGSWFLPLVEPGTKGISVLFSGDRVDEEQTITDPASIALREVQHLDVNQTYLRTVEALSLIARLYVQAMADPIYRGNASGNIGWIQHDLNDTVELVSEDEGIDETCTVTEQEIDIKGRSVALKIQRSNWPFPYHDWINTLSWISGSISETFSAGLASPVPDTVTGPTLLTDGSQRISISWTYSDTEIPHSGFAVLINVGDTDPGIPTLASHDNILLYPKNFLFAILETAADQHVSFAVAAYRGTESAPFFGTFVTSAAAPDWQDLTLEGAIQAASVPSNVPVFAAGSAVQQEDGSTEYKITWTYAQGAITADGFYVLGRYGAGAPGLPTLVTNDLQRIVGPDARSIEVLGAKATLFGSFAVVAYRNTVEGPAYTAVITDAGWTDLQASATIDLDNAVVMGTTGTTVGDVGAVAATGAPTNDPVPTAINLSSTRDGSCEITLTWTYAQGAVPATGLRLIWNHDAATGIAAPTLAAFDAMVPLSPEDGTYIVTGYPANEFFYFGIVAYRVDKSGVSYGAVITSAGAPDWQNVQGSALITLDDDVEVDGRGIKLIKEDVDDAFLKTTDNADDITESATKKWAGESGADITGDHEAATIAGQGNLATKNSVDFATGEVTNKTSDNIAMVSAPAVSVDDFVASIIIFKDSYWNIGGAADATTPPERTFSRNIVGAEVYWWIKSTFRKRSGYNMLRMTAYVKMLTTWAPTAHDIETRIRIMNYDGTVHQITSNNNIVDGAYTRRSHDMDISALTDDEIYQVWIGYAIEHQAGGAGQSDIFIWAPIVEVRPD